LGKLALRRDAFVSRRTQRNKSRGVDPMAETNKDCSDKRVGKRGGVGGIWFLGFIGALF
jgi:hypothetical protein